MHARTAILVGATGLVGRELLGQLLADPRIAGITVLTRRPTGTTHERLHEHLVDFDRPDTWVSLVTGDLLFSALGTTVKAAGSQSAQYKVDYTYQYNVARAARDHGCDTYVLVSSVGASPKALFFYARMKGELERDTAALGFPHTRILRPGPLAGDRQESRPGEETMLRVLKPLSAVLPAAARPIHAAIVARAGIAAAFDPTPGLVRYDPRDLFRAGA